MDEEYGRDRMNRILGAEDQPTAPTSPDMEEFAPKDVNEGNVALWAEQLGLDPKKLVEKFRSLDEDGGTDPLILDISTGLATRDWEKDKVERLMKKRHFSFFLCNYHPSGNGTLLVGSFAGHVPSRKERIDMGIRTAQLRGGVDLEALDYQTRALTQNQGTLEFCLDFYPPWFKLDLDEEETEYFFVVGGEVRARIDNFR